MQANPESLTKLLQNLDAWRHLPSYRLESRADPFFGLYMRDVVAARMGEDLHELVIPEFPLRLGTIEKDRQKAKNQSVKVDFALFKRDLGTLYLVELKTDQESLREKQNAYLDDAQACNGGIELEKQGNDLIEGILTLATVSKHRGKYRWLLGALREIEAVDVPEELPTLTGEALTRALREAKSALTKPMDVHIIYVQPYEDETKRSETFKNNSHKTAIYFDEFAERLPVSTDPVAAEFYEYLERWATVPAGSGKPASGGG